MTPASPKSIRIWWDTAVQAYRISTPYNEKFVDLLKAKIPGSDRAWDPTQKIWTVTENYMSPVQQLAELCFTMKATVITRAQAEAAQQPRTVASSPLGEATLAFFQLCGFDALNRAYRHAAAQLHPDHGGSMEEMTKLNALWQKLQKEVYNKQ